MIPEIGHFALIMALCMALLQGIMPLVGTWQRNAAWISVARPAAYAQAMFVVIAFACLAYSFLNNDFSVEYVARNSNSALPAIYRFSAVWGAHEGSLLLWALMLSGWTVAVALFSRSLPFELVSRAIAVLGLISTGFLLFMILTSNPFVRLLPAVAEGRDLNPLLQDVGLAIHPPMLYMGYVGFSVVFSLSIAALIGGRVDAIWARWSRPWTAVAWSFLTLGIALGSWWAYYELGWGGWWFWDPVENASFMPWLVGTALLHSLAVTDKRSGFKNWTILLAIFSFSLSLLGTFLVRSGVLVSVHAFATDPARGIFILIFLGLVIGSSLLLYAWRAPGMKDDSRFNLCSRETMLLLNNVLLVVAALTVLLGTLYPLIVDALGIGKISVGPPYFASVFVPLMLPLVVLMGFGVVTRWKSDSLRTVILSRRYVFLASAVLAVVIVYGVMGQAGVMTLLGAVIGLWALLTPLVDVRKRVAASKSVATGLRQLPRSFVGMTLAHAGIGIFVIGVTFTSSYNVEKDVRMTQGGQITLAGYRFNFEGINYRQGPNYRAASGKVNVFWDDALISVLYPEKRIYQSQRNPMSEVAIDAGLFRDIYIALGDQLDNTTWSLRVHYKPFIRWVWLGAIFMTFGGLLAASDRRYRLAARNTATAQDTLPADASILPAGGNT